MPRVSYEVRTVVREDLCRTFESYMTGRHISDVMATGLFVSASFESSAPGRYRVRYGAETREDLDRYLAEHAAELRADFKMHFPDGVELSREEWTAIKRFP